MAVNLSALAGAGQQFFDDSGVPLSGGKLYSYAAGTTTPQTTYTSASGSTPLSNPIILNSGGRVPTGEIWITAGSNYKFVLKTSTDTTLATWDNITGINGTGITSNASNVTYDPAGTGAVSTTVQAKLRQIVSVKDFGAVGNGSTDDTAAINAAILAVNTAGGGTVVVPNGTFMVSPSTVSGIATGVACIVMRDNVDIDLQGTVKAISGSYGAGAFYGMVRCLDTGLSNASITGSGTIDGNRANQIANTQASNIFLPVTYNVNISGISCINANGMGIQFVQPSYPTVGATSTACSIENCFVNNCTNIGIQISHTLFARISNNTITTCTNNGIDIYGEAGTSVADNGVISVIGNVIGGVLVGVFVETSNRVSVSGNSINGTTYGVKTNRINGQPNTIAIVGNTIANTQYGVSDTGDSGGILISSNSVSVFTTAGVQLGAGTTGNVSYVTLTNNVFSPSTTTTNIVAIAGSQASFNIFRQNYLTDGSHNSANLIVNTATTTAGCTFELPITLTVIQPVKETYAGGATTSGGTATITVPANKAGKIVIKSTSGGSNYSIWTGVFVSSTTGTAVAVSTSTFVAGQNNVASVTASTSTFVITITFAATGSAGTWSGWAEYL